ncbi:hypothetical protein TNCV_2536431 [Trichonephila clavipes]|nr:hypothetical protein TNCV_2536431 [Trichonephila clavipes]
MHQFKFPREIKDDESLHQQEFKAAYKCIINFETEEIEITDLRVSLDENTIDEINMAKSSSLENKKYLKDGISVISAKTGTEETSVKSFETDQLNTEISTDIEISDQTPSSSSTEFVDNLHRDENYTSIENEDTSFKTSHLVLKTQSSDSDQSRSSSSTETVDIFNLEETCISIENQDTSFEISHLDLNTESTDIEISDQSHPSSSTEFVDALHLEESCISIENQDTSFEISHLDLNTEGTDIETSNQSHYSSSTEILGILDLEENKMSIEKEDTSFETSHLELNTESTDIEISNQSPSSSSTEIADIIDLEENYIPSENEDTSFMVGYMDLNTEYTDIETSNQSESSSSTNSTDDMHFEENYIPVENDCYFVHEYHTDREEQYRSPEEQFNWDHGSDGKELYQQITETPDFLSEVVGLLENMKSNSEINIDPNDYDIQVSDTEEIESIERSRTFSKKDSIPRKIVLSDKAVNSIKEEICKKFYENSKVVRPEEVTDKNALKFFFNELLKPSDRPECELCSGRGKKYVLNWFDRFMESNVNTVSNVFKKFSQYCSTEMGMRYTMMPSW